MAPVRQESPLSPTNFSSTMLARLSALREEASLADVRVVADNNIQFSAHRVVLAAASDFFLQLFQNRDTDKTEPTTVHLRNCDAVSVQKVLDYLYSGELSLDNNSDSTKVFNIAKTCKIRGLEELLLRRQTPSKSASTLDLQDELHRSESGQSLESNKSSVISELNESQRPCDMDFSVNSPTGSTISGVSVIQMAPKSAGNFSSETVFFPDSAGESKSSHLDDKKGLLNATTDKPLCPLHSSYVCQCLDTADKTTLPSSPSLRAATAPPSVACAPVNFTSVIKSVISSPTQANLLPTKLQSIQVKNELNEQHDHHLPNSAMKGKQTNSGPKRKRNQGVSTGDSKRFASGMLAGGAVQMPLLPLQEGEQMPELTIEEQIQQTNDLMMLSTEVDGEIQLPVDTTSGWCRNRKYIIKTPAGYQCSLCKKTYHRYNSTSYHVTIYHRNPPIRCDQEGCNFTTREARYIHFHKYYRHNILLPQNIEVDSRSCTFCKHIAKSPAMLEKHINRHMPDCVGKGGKTCKCPVCFKELASRHSLVQHMLVHNDAKSFQCDQCAYKGRTVSNLKQHKMFKHSDSMWKNKHNCPDCSYTSPSEANLVAHRKRTHGVNNTQEQGDEPNALGSSEEEVRSVSELSNGNGMGGTSDSSDTGDSTAPPPLKLISLSYDQSSISNSKPVRSRKRQSAIRNGGGECRFDGAVEADRLLKGMGPPATPSGCISSAPASPLYGPASGSLRLPTIPNGIFPDFYANNGGKSRSGDDAPQHRISVGYRSENDLISSTSRSSSDSLMSGSSNCRSVVYDYGSV